MSFKLGPKVLIVNDPAQAQLLFYAKLASGIKNLVESDDAFGAAFANLATSPDGAQTSEGTTYSPGDAQVTAAIAGADFLRIYGFLDLDKADVVSVIGSKGVASQKQVSTITFTVPTPTAGDEVSIDLAFQSSALESEFASHLSDYKIKKRFTLVVSAGETATTLATKLVNDINGIIDSGWDKWVTATSAAGVVTLTSAKGSITFTASFSGTGISAGRVTAAFATSTVGYSGRNTYDQLKALRLETVNDAYAESAKTAQIPSKSAKYSSYLIKKNVSRPDLAGTAHINDSPSGRFDFIIYVNETTCANYITALALWLNNHAPVKTQYTSTTANGVLGGDPTNTTIA
jgi:hypothetical protein